MKSALVLLAACAPAIYRAPVQEPGYYSIKADGSKSDTYSRIDAWASYGTRGLGAQTAIAAAYAEAQHAPPPANQVAIYNASLPAGVTLEDGALKIADDAAYEAVGRFEIGYSQSAAPRESEIEPDLHRLAQVAQGDTIVVEVQRRDQADDRVRSMAGVVLRRREVAAAAHRERARVHLVYSANGAGCPNGDAFADEVSARLGYSPWQVAAPALRTEIWRDEGAYHAKLSLPGSASKSLNAASCEAVIDAAITAIAVELD